MANDVFGVQYDQTGKTLIANVRNDDGEIWDTTGTPAFETYSTAAIANYDLAGTEQGTASRFYEFTFPPTITAGIYSVTVFDGAASETNEIVGAMTIHWDGSKIIPISDIVDALAGIGSGSGSAFNFAVTYDNTTTDTIDNAAAVDKGSGLVGIPVTGHAFTATREVTIASTTNYNGSFTIISETANEVVITASFVSETFAGSETIVSSVAGVAFTGSQTGTFANTNSNLATFHQIDDAANVLNLIHVVECGVTHTAVSIIIDAYLNGNGDSLTIELYSHVLDAWKIFDTISGRNGASVEEFTLSPFSEHTGTGGTTDAGRVFIRYGSTSTNPTLFIARVVTGAVASVAANVGDSIWADSNQSNTNTVVGTDGRPENPVSTMAAVNTLLASANLHQVRYAPGSSFTFDVDQTDEIHTGRDWTLGLGGRNITGSFIFGASVTGVSTATAEFEFEECDFGTVTMDNDGHYETCSFEGGTTFTIGQSGNMTFHNCFTEGTGDWIIDFSAVGNSSINLYHFNGEVQFKNMSPGDTVHITGAGMITTSTCTGGTIEHDGFFEYTDAGGNVTEQQSDIKVAVDEINVDIYHAEVKMTIDDLNTQDEYQVVWYLNSVEITTGITLPTIRVVKRVDGTDLIAETAMTEIGTTETYKFDEATNRTTAGEGVLIIVTITHAASVRTWPVMQSRDSTA